MSVNPDMSATTGVAEEFVDLEHQVIRQKVDFTALTTESAAEVLPGDPAGTFSPGERQLDREEIAQLVVYRRYATINFLTTTNLGSNPGNKDLFGIVDASVGINGDLFRSVTTQEAFQVGPDNQTVLVDTGGEIGLLDNYQLYAQPIVTKGTDGFASGGIAQKSENTINYYDYPTGGPIVDSFDEISCGFAAGIGGDFTDDVEVQIELRYDFWWDVAEQGRSTNPFGRPSTR